MSKLDKKADIKHRIECAKCGKTAFVDFVPDGSRNYYCDECLSQFNLEKKMGKVKKEFDENKGQFVFSYVCDICHKVLKTKNPPMKEGGKIICKLCYEEIKREERKSKRKNVVLPK